MFSLPRFAGSLAVAAGLMAASTSQAFGPATAPATATTHKGIAAELHKAHELLEKADHDYDGHRAKAAHEVREALKEMMGTHHKNTSGTATTAAGQKTATAGTAKSTITPVAGQKAAGTAGKGTMKMPQEQSDKMLLEAEKILNQTMTKMPSGHKAAGKVQEAIKEIGVALSKK